MRVRVCWCQPASADSVSAPLCRVIVMSACNDKSVVPPSKYKPTQLPMLTTSSVYMDQPVVIFTFSHKACILTEEQGFPVFRRSLEGVKIKRYAAF